MKDNLLKIEELGNKLAKISKFNDMLITAINTSHEGIAILNSDGIYVYMNSAHESMFGYGKNELIGKSWTSIYSKDDVKRFIEHIFPIIDKEGYWSGEATAICKNGVDTIEEVVYLTSLPEGGLICTCRDKNFCTK